MSDGSRTKTTADVALGERKALEHLTMETRAAVERAGIVIVPDEGFRDYAGPVFPQGTVDFLQFLREHAPHGTEVAIAAEDTDYKEVVLHSDIVRLATLFVEYVAAPVVMSLIAAYLKDFLGSRFGRAEARTAIVVHRKDGAVEQTVRISYEGPAQNVEQALKDAIAGMPTGLGETPAVTGTITTAGAQPRAPRKIGSRKKKQRRK